ncbi:glyoxalase [Gemmatimonadetes bacterium T265]|nr:glyoxalase [Gemmatimonadetes bacterium T265]
MTTPAAASSLSPLTPAAASVRGRFLWYDLMVPDVDAAIRFYAAVTGWTTAPWGTAGEGSPYTMWMNGASPIGGVMTQTSAETAGGVPPYWMAHIGTPDVDATYRDALALGARSFVAPSDIPDVGRFAIVSDPQGAVFSMFQPSNPSPAPSPMPAVGEFSWHELPTIDPTSTFDFYARLFGWEKTEAMPMGPAGVYQMFGQAGTTYGAVYPSAASNRPSQWLLYVRVGDLTRALDAVRQGGGQVLREPTPVPGGQIAHCADPHGAHFALHEATAPEAQG